MKKPIWIFATLYFQFAQIFANCNVGEYTICNFENVSRPMFYPIYTNSSYTDINFEKSYIPKLSSDSFSVKAGRVFKLAIRNSRVKDIDKDALAKFPNLFELILDYNNLTIINQEFHKQGSLNELSLSHNSIKSIDAEAFKNNSRLQSLDLSFNKLSCMESPLGKTVRSSFSPLTSLQKLDLSSNKLAMLNRSTFSNNRNLKYLNLSNNAITGFKVRVFQRLSKLIYLNLHSNSLSKLDFVFFVGLRSLQTLDLSLNRLLVIDTIGFHHTPLLENLQLHYNFLREVPVINLAHYTNLESISIRENKIDCPTTAEILHQLKLVDIKLDERTMDFKNRDGISCNISFPESFATATTPTEKYDSAFPVSHPTNYYGIRPTPSYWDNYYTKSLVSRPEQSKGDYITRHGSRGLGRPAGSRLISKYWDNYPTASSESKSLSNARDHYNKYTTISWDFITRYNGPPSQRPSGSNPPLKYWENSAEPSENKSQPKPFWDVLFRRSEAQPSSNYSYTKYYSYTLRPSNNLGSTYGRPSTTPTSKSSPKYWENTYTRSPTTIPPPRNSEAVASQKDFLYAFERVFENSTFYRMFSEYIENQLEKWENLTGIVKELVVENEYHKKLEKMGVETSKGINLEVKLGNETVSLVVIGKPSNLKDDKTQTTKETCNNLKKHLESLVKDSKAKIWEENQQLQFFNDLNNFLTDLMKDTKLKNSEENQENANNLQENFRILMEGNKAKTEEKRNLGGLNSFQYFLENIAKHDTARNSDSNSHNKPREIYNGFNMTF